MENLLSQSIGPNKDFEGLEDFEKSFRNLSRSVYPSWPVMAFSWYSRECPQVNIRRRLQTGLCLPTFWSAHICITTFTTAELYYSLSAS